ncbi:hypothetical protein JA1_004349 [Spathaspora sp. JA1]|nr:hypothetical protein JA1_004349 [Spathaspora sp. JA1]
MSKVKTSGISRRRHTNSKLGCFNCKRKKIRCNEQLPECGNCVRGRKETCSYLSLSPEDIERIRLTHSLRNSQNKLLNQNYRLPASPPNISTPSSNYESRSLLSSLSPPPLTLEFKFELAGLPIKIPSFHYPEIKFDNFSLNDFPDNGFELSSDNDTLRCNSPNKEGTMLSNGFKQIAYFNPIRSRFTRKITLQDVNTRVVADLTHHGVLGKINLLDLLSDMILELPSVKDLDVLAQAYICLGEAIILNVFRQRQKFMKLASSIDTIIDCLNQSCLERHEYYEIRLRGLFSEFNARKNSMTHSESSTLSEILAYSSYLMTFAVLMMKFDAQSYFHACRGVIKTFQEYSTYMVQRNLQPISTVSFLMSNLQYNIVSINIPSYYPQFIFEIESNLRSLRGLQGMEFVFKFDDDNSTNLRFQKLEFEYRNLLKFLNGNVLPIIFVLRDENYITTYPPMAIYEIFKEWHTIFPSEAMTYKPMTNGKDPSKLEFLNALTTTLYMYYFAIAVSLDALFPACKYLYGMSFMVPTNKFFIRRELMTLDDENPFIQGLHTLGCRLQGHVYYASRIFAFFRRRYVFYHNNIKWSNPYDDLNESNRFETRVIKNTEIPIKSFNTTIIRPEHYPSKRGAECNVKHRLKFTREDEAMIKNTYSRNIETLNFFDETIALQYDCETMLLLRDYRPPDITTNDRPRLEVKDINQYYDDRTKILNSLQ